MSCLADCLKYEKGQRQHNFKMKNAKKWLTLTKNSPNKNINQSKWVQLPKYKPCIKLIKVPCSNLQPKPKGSSIQINADLSDLKSSRRSTSPNHYNDSVQVIRNSATDVFVRPASNQARVRSLSQGLKCKINAISRPIHFIYSQDNRQRSTSEEKNKILSIGNSKKEQIKFYLPQQYLISPIKQEIQQRQKRSSLFQGAKSIVSRLVTSRNNKPTLALPFNPKTAQKDPKIDIQQFYENARLCETENAFTNQSILTDGQLKKQQQQIHHQVSFDAMPMSPHTKQYNIHSKFKIGRLLGVGKWAHVYLCQDKVTNSIYAMKQIFKQSIQAKSSFDVILKSIDRLTNLNHAKLMNIYSKFETKDKVCLLLEYCGASLYEQLKQKGLFPLQKLKKYSKDLIQALVYLHENQIPHGNINNFQVFANFDQCKLKPSYPYCKQERSGQENLLKIDIQGLAIVIFEMGHGLVPTLLSISTLYEKEKLYQDSQTRKVIIDFIKNKIALPEKDPVYILLNDLIKTLLCWNQNWRLMASQCINHKFFSLSQTY